MAGEGVGGVVGDEHPKTGHPMRVEHPAVTHPVANGDHRAPATTVDSASFHGTPFLLPIRQVMRPTLFWQLRHCLLPSQRQQPAQTRDLYLIAGIASGLMAKASHDLGAPHDAMTHARTGYACADNAGHDGLRAWTRGLQALITYWSGRLEDSVLYTQLGAEAAARSRGTAGVWLASSEARSLAALNRLEDAHNALVRATEARDRVQPDELDSLGGLCTFSRPRQLYYAADALVWGGETEANHTERLALEALDAYADAPDEDRAFGDESGTRSALAVARVLLREIDGAAEALAPVLELPPPKRIHGIVTSVEHVRSALRAVEDPGRDATDLAVAIEGFTSERLALQR